MRTFYIYFVTLNTIAYFISLLLKVMAPTLVICPLFSLKKRHFLTKTQEYFYVVYELSYVIIVRDLELMLHNTLMSNVESVPHYNCVI